MSRNILFQEDLKCIACITMLIDHVGAVFFPNFIWLRVIGRIAFPIYCFLLAEGAHYTKNPFRYAQRLLVGLMLAEIPYDMALYGSVTLAHQNVMFTLLLAFLMAMSMKKMPLWGKVLTVIPFALAADALNTDYGAMGIILAAVFVISREFSEPTLIQALGSSLVYLTRASRYSVQPAAVLSMIPISLYSGKKRSHSKVLQWVFYLFYPAHLLVLWLIRL